MSEPENEAVNNIDPNLQANETAENQMAGEGAQSAEEPDPFAVLTALQAENADLKDRLLRAVAESENARRRAERERADAVRYAASGFGRDMVQVSDNLRRAIAAVSEEDRASSPETVKALVDGVEATERQLLATFERHGIKEITPALGDRFDPNLHEAMFEVPNSGQPGGSVVQVIEAGYMLGDRLLRAARVGVAKADDTAPRTNGGQVDTRA